MADTVNPNLALVQRMYECFNKNDMETIRREIFAPDLVWNLPGRHPLAGTKHGGRISGLLLVFPFPSGLQPVLPVLQFLFGLEPVLFTLTLLVIEPAFTTASGRLWLIVGPFCSGCVLVFIGYYAMGCP